MGLAIVLICALFAGAIIPSTMNAEQKKSSQKKNTKKVLVVYFPQWEQQKKQQKKSEKATGGRAGNKSTAETQICGSSCGKPFWESVCYNTVCIPDT